MDNLDRYARYARQLGHSTLTANQRRRLRKKGARDEQRIEAEAQSRYERHRGQRRKSR